MAAPVHVELNGRMQIDVDPEFNDGLRELVERWPYRPYSYLPRITRSSQSAYVLNALAHAQQKGAVTYLGHERGQLQALLQLDFLPWDSEVLGFPVGRIAWWIEQPHIVESGPCRERLLRLMIGEARRRNIQYLFTRVPAKDVVAIHMLEKNGFRLVDGLLTFGVAPPEGLLPSEQSDGLRWGAFAPEDLPALRKIAAGSFSIDRFHADPAIGKEKADEVHRRWVENSCAGFADCVLVARDTEPIGFTTLKIDRSAKPHLGVSIGVVVLVATSGEHRRKGVSRFLTLAALQWFRQAGCEWVEVGTQLANINASRVYQAAGFKLVGSSLTFRRLL